MSCRPTIPRPTHRFKIVCASFRSSPSGSSSGMHAPHLELFDLDTETIADAVDRDELAATVPVRLAASLAVVHLSSAVAYSLERGEVDIDELSSTLLDLSRTLLDQWLRGMQP